MYNYEIADLLKNKDTRENCLNTIINIRKGHGLDIEAKINGEEVIVRIGDKVVNLSFEKLIHHLEN